MALLPIETTHDMANVLRALAVQSQGLLERGNVTLEELQAFREVGETLLRGTDYSLLGGELLSDAGPDTDLELGLEHLRTLVEKLHDQPSLEAHSSQVLTEVQQLRAGLEALQSLLSPEALPAVHTLYNQLAIQTDGALAPVAPEVSLEALQALLTQNLALVTLTEERLEELYRGD